ncbi:MAG: hypothetical protein COZ46_01855 [Verrucomicrobia bacterium CG_4_10_14_3_um_filter_43_23]|nr:MAG: hypothetical protein AUJ82_01870 [Verrucomicrobia bacterium CG1_02_43_26]PIP59642.1 MAG: hypothetical protein COX01_03460 [Verrucomicrobia bacterium CG22_combo_CG10-13_8_21_14_all_43_17]PIX58941.1 MAG: hypothetical protein COZ46_01855 [Verrucomicrobia bacterium CG_4_10_14_3_um_filter_43_23]PIY63086.1 MAG: hypothetical protein COY94_00205 [Verrucomicrobia bacterium CG_4_10_14_0_8_um_filter_43_34]PJA43593.1 MAG: hypothetical protein CO175_07130 [Verrucomicrobia bacterium CG_4_9_14_3_um_fi
MKIVILQDYLRCGGTEKQSVFLVNHLNEAGYDALLITLRPGGLLWDEVKDEKVFSLQKGDTGFDWYAPRLFKTIKKLSPDIVICMGRIANMYGSFVQNRFPKLHVISTLRTGKKLSCLYKRSLKTSKSILTNCQWWKNDLLKRGFNSNKIEVIPNPIVLSQSISFSSEDRLEQRKKFGASEDTIIFICVQGFRPGKNHAKLIEHFAKLDRKANWQLWLVGEGEQKRACEVIVNQLGLGDKIHFMGFQKNPAPYYQAADVAVSTSKEDAFPNFIIEAQSLGLPIIAVDTVGVQEAFIPNQSGFLVSHDRPEEFVKYLELFLQSPNQIQKMGEVGRIYAQDHFSPDVIKKQIDQYFEMRTKKHKGRVIVLARWLTYGDGVSIDALGTYYSLIDAGYDAHIYANERHSSLKHEPIKSFKVLQKLPLTEDDILIYHFTSGWNEGIAFLRKTPCKKVLRYHNVTPAEFFEGYSESHTKRCREGRAFLSELCKIDWYRACTPSNYNANELISHGLDPKITQTLISFTPVDSLVSHIKTSSDPQEKYLPGTPVNILSVGRISPQKNHADLIRAFAFYHKEHNPNSQLTLFGKQNRYLKKYVEDLNNLAKELEVDHALIWINGGSDNVLHHAYQKAHIFAKTSKHEGLCVPLIEAMAEQVPIVAFAYAAVPETVGGAGMIIPDNDPHKMAEAFHRIINDEHERAILLKNAALRYQEHFQSSAIKLQFLQFINSLSPNR